MRRMRISRFALALVSPIKLSEKDDNLYVQSSLFVGDIKRVSFHLSSDSVNRLFLPSFLV